MIAGLISPAVESPGQESDNDSLPGKGSYTSSHASSDDEQPGILLLDDSTSSSHATSSTTEGRQAIPVTPDRPTAIPRLKILALRYRWLLRPANDFGVGRSSRWNLFNALGMQENDSGVAQLPRSPSLLEMAAQTTVWARPSVHSDCGGKCIPHSHGPDRAADPANWRTSCLSASLMRDASRKDADACSNEALRVSSQLQLASAVD